jgi:hypothetical protein
LTKRHLLHETGQVAFCVLGLPIKDFVSIFEKKSRWRYESFLYPDFTNRPDQKSNGLNPGDSDFGERSTELTPKSQSSRKSGYH